MAVKVTNKKPLSGNKRSHACNATKMQQKPNLQIVRLEEPNLFDENMKELDEGQFNIQFYDEKKPNNHFKYMRV